MKALHPRSSFLAVVCWLLFAGVLASGACSPASAQGAQGPLIRLRYATFDPLRSQPPVAPNLRMPPIAEDQPGYFLLQFRGPVRQEWVAAVRACGVSFEDYVPDYAFVVRMTLKQAALLPLRYRFVRWTGPFHTAYKIDPEVLKAGEPTDTGAMTFSGIDTRALAGALAQRGVPVTDAARGLVRSRISAADAVRLAGLPEVKWVGPLPEIRPHNDRSTGIMNISGQEGVRVRGLFGEGQIIGVADSGLDTGDMTTINEDFRNRVIQGIPLGRKSTGDWSDYPSLYYAPGHGTHVAGSVLGNGVNSGSDPENHAYEGSFAGAAPEARLVFQSLSDRYYYGMGVPSNLYDLFQEPYDLGARIHTNSWGSGGTGWYSSRAAAVDQFMWEHPDMLILYSAGNDGEDRDRNGVVDLRSLSDPATAKNIICVGASETYRPPTERWGGYTRYTWSAFGFATAPISTDYISDNPRGMAAFSSRGPTWDGRIKPDLVAPGTDIVSVWARGPGQRGYSGWDDGWGPFKGAYSDRDSMTKYIYSGGTSMATPLTAGAAALVREFYLKGKPSWAPSSALVKATLINGAAEMSPGQYGAGATREMARRPNPVEGWGRVDVAGALYPAAPRAVHWIDRPGALATGKYHRLQYQVKYPAEPLRVTLVWTDAPGTPYAYSTLVNDLDLKVTDPAGNVLYGNDTNDDGVENHDNTNNVECVDIARPAAGTYEIRIEAANVPVGGQTYALVVSGGGEPLGGRFPDIVPPEVSFITPTDAASLTGGATHRIEISAVDNQAIDRVTVTVDDTTSLGSRFGAPYVFYWNTAAIKTGLHTIVAKANDFARNETTARITVKLVK